MIAMVLQGPRAIAVWRDMLGPTHPARARVSAPDSIRAHYGLSNTRNAVHGSDSPASAEREIAVFFPRAAGRGATEVSGRSTHAEHVVHADHRELSYASCTSAARPSAPQRRSRVRSSGGCVTHTRRHELLLPRKSSADVAIVVSGCSLSSTKPIIASSTSAQRLATSSGSLAKRSIHDPVTALPLSLSTASARAICSTLPTMDESMLHRTVQ
eukprot:Unigene4484_Nuclearia_a/m.13711 Unigene4484_Nuclearia_a/g.13711  ORF Unigene4484_Nuclearia_a/g.13711 Unigene4484_Nuclearia_a/m.13711 type:complete len:213 (+) Unigene4484_Nuclearia_a:280-918(+)